MRLFEAKASQALLYLLLTGGLTQVWLPVARAVPDAEALESTNSGNAERPPVSADLPGGVSPVPLDDLPSASSSSGTSQAAPLPPVQAAPKPQAPKPQPPQEPKQQPPRINSSPGSTSSSSANSLRGTSHAPSAGKAVGELAALKAYDSFSDLRADILNAIGGTTRRVWISTSYLTDGELVSSLYVAQYRKVDVEVLLGRGKANAYMSRLNYLKNQNIPVYLRPERRPGPATQILCDEQLYELDGELDFMTKYKHFTLTRADAATTTAFMKTFADDINKKVPAIPAPIPMVGHINPQTSAGRGVHSPRYAPHYDANDGSGAYTYGGRSPPRPEDVPAKLPKVLKYEQQPKQPPVLKDDTEQD